MHFARPLALALVLAACSDQTVSPPSEAALATDAVAEVSGSQPIIFNVTLRAENEPNGTSTSESNGRAQVRVNDDGTMEFIFLVNNKSSELFHRAHIHKAAAGSNGPIHWDLMEAGNPVASVSDQPSLLRGIARPRAAAVLADLLANPELYYVNIHSTTFPGGSVRGQLR